MFDMERWNLYEAVSRIFFLAEFTYFYFLTLFFFFLQLHGAINVHEYSMCTSIRLFSYWPFLWNQHIWGYTSKRAPEFQRRWCTTALFTTSNRILWSGMWTGAKWQFLWIIYQRLFIYEHMNLLAAFCNSQSRYVNRCRRHGIGTKCPQQTKKIITSHVKYTEIVYEI